METTMAPGRPALMLSLLAGAALLACYKPNIKDGGLECGPNRSCPEDFRCAADNHCWRGDGGSRDLAAERMCTVAAPTPSCDVPPSGGQACNPTCQTGCECGRCTVVRGVAVCLENAGTKGRGELCNVEADDCQPGLGCIREVCGNNLGRCSKFCGTNADCPDGLGCIPGGTFGVTICETAPQACDPIGGTSGCPDSALACYVSGAQTLCDCRGTIAPGESCTVYNDCVPGYRCIGVGGSPRCQRVCRLGGSDCPLPSLCLMATSGSTYGYCGP